MVANILLTHHQVLGKTESYRSHETGSDRLVVWYQNVPERTGKDFGRHTHNPKVVGSGPSRLAPFVVS